MTIAWLDETSSTGTAIGLDEATEVRKGGSVGVDVKATRTARLAGVSLALVVVASACSSDSGQASEADQSSTPATETASTNSTPAAETTSAPPRESTSPGVIGVAILAAGELELSSVNSQDEAGYHQVLTATDNLPSDLGPTAGSMLVIKLWDAGRPEQTCSEDHPISGCATVDWGDAIDRPSVPPGGVFDNSITFELATGEHSFFLSESGALNDEPDALEPET